MKKEKYNQYDEWYENHRYDYSKGIRDLEESFKRMRGAYLMHQMTGSDKWEQHERESYTAFQLVYNYVCMIYNELEKYYEKHHNEMEKCKTWNTTLLHPDEWCIQWVGGSEINY